MDAGRPSIRTQEIDDYICENIAEGRTLRSICRESGMPNWRTVYLWREQDEEFSARIARARIMGFDAIAEDTIEIADTPLIGEKEETSSDGKKVVREDMLGHRKLQIETRHKLLAKWDPKRYGEQIRQELTGAAGAALMIGISTEVKPKE